MITKKTSPTESREDDRPKLPAAPSRAPGGFWSFLKTLFVGTAGLALLAVFGTLASNSWLTANQRAEAEKAAPWTNPSFTTTAVTTGGMLARWMDNDGNLENGHSYIKGIYDLWKVGSGEKWRALAQNQEAVLLLPQLWQSELNADLDKISRQTKIRRDIEISERERLSAEAMRRGKEAELSLAK